MDKPHHITPDADIDINWKKLDALPTYYTVNNTYDFLLTAAYAEQQPIGMSRDENGYWCVVFKYSRAIKYINKYPEDHIFSEEQISELRKTLNPQYDVLYSLLEIMERDRASNLYEV